MLGLSNSSNLNILSGSKASGLHLPGMGAGGPNLAQIIASVQSDIKSLKTQLDNIPGFTKGKRRSIFYLFRPATSISIGKVLKQPR